MFSKHIRLLACEIKFSRHVEVLIVIITAIHEKPCKVEELHDGRTEYHKSCKIIERYTLDHFIRIHLVFSNITYKIKGKLQSICYLSAFSSFYIIQWDSCLSWYYKNCLVLVLNVSKEFNEKLIILKAKYYIDY